MIYVMVKLALCTENEALVSMLWYNVYSSISLARYGGST